jgi:uncharacterized protein (TIGR02453 family)
MWPPEALEFLRELEANNEREWFRANRARYDAHLVAPARALATELADFGAPRFFRPYNDARFHARPPIKEQLGVAVGTGPAAMYFELSLDGLFVGAGLYHPSSDQLERFRAAIDDEARAARFGDAVRSAARAGLTLAAPALRRAPRGYPPDHPRVQWLRLRDLIVQRRHALEPWLHEPRCVDVVRGEFQAARSLVAWLTEHVGPPAARAAASGQPPAARAAAR